MAIEGGDALEGKIKNLDSFYERGVRMVTVVHAHNNEIGCHQRSQKDGPLTPTGTRVVERMMNWEWLLMWPTPGCRR